MPSLLDLPVEVLHEILSYLSPWLHHSGMMQVGDAEFIPDFSYVEDEWTFSKGLTSLANLARSCKALRRIAQPCMFYAPYTSCPVDLVRTMLRRPDLANEVKELRITLWEAQIDDLSEGDAATFESQILRRFEDPFPDVGESPTHVPGGQLLLQLGLTRQWRHESDLTRYIAGLAIALSPRVERLLIEPLNFDSPHLIQDSLPHLREICINDGDTGMGVQLGNIQGIVQAAPALRTLRCHMASALDICHDTLTDLHLTFSSLPPGDFLSLMDAFPKLQRLWYESGLVCDSQGVSPKEASQAVLLRRDTLTHLCLDYSNDMSVVLDGHEYLETLTEMTMLQSLSFNGGIINYDAFESAEAFANMLPSSLKTICILPDTDGPDEGILNFASACPIELPSLTKLSIRTIYSGEWDAVEKACKANNVMYSLNTGVAGMSYW